MKPEVFLSVSDLNRILNLTLEESLPEVSFEGEISEISRAQSGHLYITLKDENAEVRIILWASTVRTLKFRPDKGQSVRCKGRPNVYQKSGALRIIVSSMQPTGEGELQKRFQQLKEKLEKEGLFAPERKRKLPFLPKAIGVVTSAQGAVIHDIMVRLKERMPQIPVYLVDVRVQGEGAAEEIASAITYLGESGFVDVIIAGRGGGSLEDLWAFNEELVVRAFFSCKVPIISAVGHEVDVSLADLAADVRAPTPTAAAEMVVPRREDLLEAIMEYEERLYDFEHWFAPLSEEVDTLSERLLIHVSRLVEQAKLKIEAASAKIKSIEPHRLIELRHKGLDMIRQRLEASAKKSLEDAKARLQQKAGVLEAVSPKRVLERGYAIVEAKGRVIKSAEEVDIGQVVDVLLGQGRIKAGVQEKEQ